MTFPKVELMETTFSLPVCSAPLKTYDFPKSRINGNEWFGLGRSRHHQTYDFPKSRINGNVPLLLLAISFLALMTFPKSRINGN